MRSVVVLDWQNRAPSFEVLTWWTFVEAVSRKINRGRCGGLRRGRSIATAPRSHARRSPTNIADGAILPLRSSAAGFLVRSSLESADRCRRWIGFVYGTKPGPLCNVSQAVFQEKDMGSGRLPGKTRRGTHDPLPIRRLEVRNTLRTRQCTSPRGGWPLSLT